MSKNSAEPTRLDLDFFQKSLMENIALLLPYKQVDWVKGVINFLETYSVSDKIESKTSGTTGEPKVIVHTKKQLQKSAQDTLDYFSLKPNDAVVSPLSVNFIAGKMMLVRAIQGQLKLTLLKPKSNPILFVSDLESYQFCPMVPLQIAEIIRAGKISELKRLGILLIGGGEINSEVLAVLKREKIVAFASFGMTETMTHFALKQLSPIAAETYACLPGYEVSTDSDSCLVVNHKSLYEQPITTRDVVLVKSSKEFIWLGRADNRINSGGIKIFPEQLEQKIRSKLPELPPFIISCEPDARLGERVIFCSELGAALPINLEQIIELAVDKYEKPAAYYKVRAFHYTSTGKLIRNRLDFV